MQKKYSFSIRRVLAVVLASVLLTIPAYAAVDLTFDTSNFTVANKDFLNYSANNTNAASTGSVSFSENKISITAIGYKFIISRTSTTTVTLSNPGAVDVYITGTAGTNLSGDVSAGTTYTEASPLTVSAGSSVQIKVKSGSGEGNSKNGIFTVTSITRAPATITTNFKNTTNAADGGTYTISGGGTTTPTPGGQGSKLTTDSPYVLSATPAIGYSFYGWISELHGFQSGQQTGWEYNPDNPNEIDTIYPKFYPTGTAMFRLDGTNTYYYYLDQAIANATTYKTIVAVTTGTAKYSDSSVTAPVYTIEDGVTLLVPYAEGANTISTSTTLDGVNSTWIHANNRFTTDYNDDNIDGNASVKGVMDVDYRTHVELTIPQGATVNVKSGGKFVVGGTIVSGTQETTGICSVTAEEHSNVIVNGILNISDDTPSTANDEGILSCCGYMLGTGTINVVGGSVYQPFTLMDYHDGHYTANSTVNGTFPANRYIMQSVRTAINISSGGKMYGYIDIFTKPLSALEARHNVALQLVIGPTSTATDYQCFIQLADNATLSATYDPDDYVTSSITGTRGTADYAKAGKTTLVINGGATLGTLKVSVYVPIVGTQSSQSNLTDFPVPYHYDIILENGTYTLPYNLVLFPGASMTVEEDADLVVSGGKFVVMDGLRDYSSRESSEVSIGTWYEYHYPSTSDLQNRRNNTAKNGKYNGMANLIVDGTMTVNSGASFGGYVQTNGSGTVTMDGTASATVGVGNVKHHGNALVNKNSGKTERTLSAWLWEKDGDLIALNTGDVYYGVGADLHTAGTYAYRVYTTANNTDTYAGVGVTGSSGAVDHAAEALNAAAVGSWCTIDGHGYQSVVTAPTCTAAGYTTHTCSGCGHSYTDTPTAASGHIFDFSSSYICTAGNCGVAACEKNGDTLSILYGDAENGYSSETFTLAVTDWYMEDYTNTALTDKLGFAAVFDGTDNAKAALKKIGFRINSDTANELWGEWPKNATDYTFNCLASAQGGVNTAQAMVVFNVMDKDGDYLAYASDTVKLDLNGTIVSAAKDKVKDQIAED